MQSNHNLQAALLYAEKGWHVFPVNGKVPYPKTKGFKDASKNPEIIKKMWTKFPEGNVAVATGKLSNVFVVDIDVKEGKVGEESIQILQAQNEELPSTVESETWSGGRQMFFLYPTDREIKSSQNKLGKDLDIRGDGGYVVAPPSVHNGKPYSWNVDPELEPLADAPSWLLDLLVMSQNPESSFKLPKGNIPKGKQDEMLFKFACSLKAQGFTPELIKGALTGALTNCQQDPKNPFTDKDISRWINSAFNYKDPNRTENDFSYDINKSGKRRPTYRNLEYILSYDENLSKLFCFNDFTQDIELCKLPPYRTSRITGDLLNDTDLLQMKSYIIKNYYIEYSVATLQEGIGKHASDNSFHPIKNYLESLVWDGKNRLDNWLIDYAGVQQSEYVKAVSAKTLIASCARIYNPGCKYDYMMILEGEQGIGKSQLVSALGDPWSAEISLIARDKDTVDKLRGKWIVEVPELTTFKKQDIESLKAFLSTQVDRTRLAYRRNSEDFPRKSIFIGTINPEGNGYLNDPTGNRRFFPVEVKKIDLVGLRQNKDQIFAEAYHRFKQKEDIYITCSKAIEQGQKIQRSKAFTDVWHDQIYEYLIKEVKLGHYKLTGHMIAEDCLGISNDIYDNRQARRIGNILRQLGWEYKNVRIRDKVAKGYACPEAIVQMYKNMPIGVTNLVGDEDVNVTETQIDWKPDF